MLLKTLLYFYKEKELTDNKEEIKFKEEFEDDSKTSIPFMEWIPYSLSCRVKPLPNMDQQNYLPKRRRR